MALAAEQRCDKALLATQPLRRIHVVTDAGKALEIFADIGAGLTAWDAELVGKPEGGNTIDDAEIDRLGAAADFRGHAFHRHTEHFRRGQRVNVDVVGKGLFQLWDVGDMREETQLDLRIVGGEQLRPRHGHKSRADFPPRFVAHRDVLQIRLG